MVVLVVVVSVEIVTVVGIVVELVTVTVVCLRNLVL